MGVIPINFGVEAEVFLRQKKNMSRYVNDLVVKWGINDATALGDAPIRRLVAAVLARGNEIPSELANQCQEFLEVLS